MYSLHWRQYFPKNQFLVIDGSALNEHPAGQVMRLERFLELEMQITKNNFIKVPERGVMCLKGEGTRAYIQNWLMPCFVSKLSRKVSIHFFSNSKFQIINPDKKVVSRAAQTKTRVAHWATSSPSQQIRRCVISSGLLIYTSVKHTMLSWATQAIIVSLINIYCHLLHQ